MHKESQRFLTLIGIFFVVLMTFVAGLYYSFPCSHQWIAVGAGSSTDPNYIEWTRYRCLHCDEEYKAFDVKP